MPYSFCFLLLPLQDATYPWAISVVFGTAAAVAGLSVLLLWETLNTNLPDTIAELEGLIDPVQTPPQEKEEMELFR